MEGCSTGPYIYMSRGMWLIGECAQSPGNVHNPQFFRGLFTIPGDCEQSP